MSGTDCLQVTDKLHLLLDKLHQSGDQPRNLPITGFLKNIINNKLQYNVLVDNWPEYKVIVVKPDDDIWKLMPRYMVCIYSKSVDCLNTFLALGDIFPKQAKVRFLGITFEMVPSIEKYCNIHKREIKYVMKERILKCVVIPRDGVLLQRFQSELESEYYTSSLDPVIHTDIVSSNWIYWKEYFDKLSDVHETVKELIELCPSIGAFTKGENKLVCWTLINVDSSSTMSHTLPEYRGRGLHRWLTLKLAQHMYEKGYTLFTYIHEDNHNLSIMKSIGAEISSLKYMNGPILSGSGSK